MSVVELRGISLELLENTRVLRKHRFVQEFARQSIASSISGESDVDELTFTLVDDVVLAQNGLVTLAALHFLGNVVLFVEHTVGD